MEIQVMRHGLPTRRPGRYHYNQERWVTLRVINGPGARFGNIRVDPQQWMRDHAGISIVRTSCMLSMMDGLQDAGHTVSVKPLGYRFKGGPTLPHQYHGAQALEYWYLGYLVGLGSAKKGMLSSRLWVDTAERIRTAVFPEMRQDVICRAAWSALCDFQDRGYYCHEWSESNPPPLTI